MQIVDTLRKHWVYSLVFSRKKMRLYLIVLKKMFTNKFCFLYTELNGGKCYE